MLQIAVVLFDLLLTLLLVFSRSALCPDILSGAKEIAQQRSDEEETNQKPVHVAFFVNWRQKYEKLSETHSLFLKKVIIEGKIGG